MRFGTVAGRLVLIDDGRALDVEQASHGELPADVLAALSRWDELRTWASTADWSTAFAVTDGQLGAPVPSPRQVFAVALNYRPHAAEAGFVAPTSPLVFTKFPTCITGPVADVILPQGNVDWEIEIVAVIGRGGYRIPREMAWSTVAGLTLGQDLSERALQLAGSPPQFSLGKSYPGFGPIGPVAVSTDEFPDPDDLAFSSSLDGEVLQQGRTSEMVFPVADLVHRISTVCPLLPGDLIFTGTPAGVGNRRTPPRYLRPGDVLTSNAKGIGEIRQRFIRSADSVT